MRPRRPAVTSSQHALDRIEVLSTVAAFLLSSTLYVAYGHPYLARGVLGDLVGLGVLTAVLLIRRRRGRHEALVCLAGIAVVSAASPEWPLRVPDGVWWPVVAFAVGVYVLVRQRILFEEQ